MATSTPDLVSIYENDEEGGGSPKLPSYAKPGPYQTTLSPEQEQQFQGWVKQNKVPWKDTPDADYDMRGYYKALQGGDPNAKQQLSGFDGKMHFPDTYKTPFHKTFSNESIYATPNAPRWQGDRLINSAGEVIADETPRNAQKPKMTSVPDLVSQFESQQSAPDLVSQFESGQRQPAKLDVPALPTPSYARSASAPYPAFADTTFNRPPSPADIAAAARASSPQVAAEKAAGRPLAPVAGAPHDPQQDVPLEADPRTGEFRQRSLVPEADRIPVVDAWTGVEPIATGLSRFRENDKPVYDVNPNDRFGPPVRTMSPEEEERQRRQRVTGATEVLQGAGQLGEAPAAAGLVLNPLPVVAGYGAGYGASSGIGSAVHGHVSPEDEELIRTASYFLPSLAGTALGLRTGSVETPEGRFSGASILGGRARAGVGVTPDVVTGRVKVGGTQFEVNVPRSRPVAPPSPEAQIMAAAQADDAMAQRAGLGLPPVPPQPKQPTPAQQIGPVLERQHVELISQAIAQAPENARGKLIAEAHGNLTQWIHENNGRVVVDGKVHIAKTPEQAETLAQKIINDAVAAHDKQQAATASEQSPAKTGAQKSTEHPLDQFLTKTRQARVPKPQAEATAQPVRTEAPISGEPADNMTSDTAAVQNVAENADIHPGQQPAVMVKEESPKEAAALAEPPKPVDQQATAKIGTEDKESGRDILQPSDDVMQNERLAGEAAPELAEKLSNIAAGVPGATFDRLRPQKELERVDEKVDDQEKPPETVPDYLASQIAADTVEAKDRLIAEIQKQFPVVKVEDNFLDGKKDLANYRSANIQVGMGNGATAEIQIVPREVQEIANESHIHYSKGREAELKGDTAERDKQFAIASKMHDAAMEKFNQRNGLPSQKSGEPDLVAQFEGQQPAAPASSKVGGGKVLEGDVPLTGPASPVAADVSRLKAELKTATDPKEIADIQQALEHAQARMEGRPYTPPDQAVAENLPANQPRSHEPGPSSRDQAAPIAASKLKPGDVGQVNPKELAFDPKRFQYKLNVNEKGVTNLLAGQKWNPDLAGVVSVWRDPADGKTYVVNGHHRAQLATEKGVDSVLVRHLNVKTAEEARARGALQNIAEGRGTAVDAAKFFRESGIGPADLDKNGISLGENTAANGLALAKLDQSIFEKVATGKMSEGRGVALGEATADPAQQEAIVKLLDKREAQGKNITEATVAELARFVASSGNRTVEQGGLFGANQQIHSLALEKAEISAYIKQQIAKERRTFAAVSTEGKAAALGQVKGQNIKAEENAKISQAAAQAEEAYNKLSSVTGPVNDALEKAARELASGYHKPEEIKQRAYGEVRAELRKSFSGEQGPSAQGLHGRPESGTSAAPEADRQASVNLPPNIFNGLREGSRNATILKELYLTGELSRRSETGLYERGPKSSYTAKDLLEPTDKTLSERRADLEKDKKLIGRPGALREREEKLSQLEQLANPRSKAEPALPGMQPHIEANQESAAQVQGEDLSSQMTAPPTSVSAKAGEMERSSPLFRDTEASGQGGLFTPKAEQESPRKGDTVTLKGGQVGTAKYVDPQMGVIRVELPKGGSKTFPLRDVVSFSNREGERGSARLLDIPAAAKDVAKEFIKNTRERMFKTYFTEQARHLEGGIYDLDRKYEANVLDAMDLLKQARKSFNATDQEAVYHAIENPAEGRTLTAGQQQLRDGYIKPLQEDNQTLREELTGMGWEHVLPFETDNYIHRVAQGKNGRLDSATAGGRMGKGNILGSKANSLNARTMFAAEDADGHRIVVHQGDGELTGFEGGRAFTLAKPGSSLKPGDQFRSTDGQQLTLKQATSREIEGTTDVRYYKNALATTVDDNLQLNRAVNAARFLEDFKQRPEFSTIAMKPEKGERAPQGWQLSPIPQFQGHYFEPRTWEVLKDLYDRMHKTNGPGIVEKIGDFLQTSVLLNPVMHAGNMADIWVTERGALKNAQIWKGDSAVRAGMKAIRAVMERNDDYRDALRNGAPLMSHRTVVKDVNALLFKTLTDTAAQDPGMMTKLREFMGIPKDDNNPIDAVRQASHMMAFMSNDVFYLQSVYEKMDSGMSQQQAVRAVNKIFPEYRVPTRVMDSKAFADFLKNRMMTWFSGYHYGRWRAYRNMVVDGLGPDVDAATRGRALSSMAMLGLMVAVGYPLYDKFWKQVSGDPNARSKRFGLSGLPSDLLDVHQGKKPVSSLIESQVTPSAIVKAGVETAINRDSFTGGRVYDPNAPVADEVRQVGQHIARNSVGPISQYNRFKNDPEGKGTQKFLYSQIGVSFPKYETESPAQIMLHNILRENMPPLTVEQQQDLDERKARIAGGDLTQKERKNAIKKLAEGEFRYYLEHPSLTVKDVERVYKAASPDERSIIGPILVMKAGKKARSVNTPQAERDDDLRVIKEYAR